MFFLSLCGGFSVLHIVRVVVFACSLISIDIKKKIRSRVLSVIPKLDFRVDKLTSFYSEINTTVKAENITIITFVEIG